MDNEEIDILYPEKEPILPKWAVAALLLLTIGGAFVMGAISGHEAALRHLADLHRGKIAVTIDAPLWSQEGIEKGMRCAKEGGTVHLGGGSYEIHETINVPPGISLRGESLIPSELLWVGGRGPVLEIRTLPEDQQIVLSYLSIFVACADTAVSFVEEGRAHDETSNQGTCFQESYIVRDNQVEVFP